jgi:signal peptidase II
VLFGAALLVAAADQGVKALVIRALPPSASIPVLPGVLSLTHVQNPGVAFGLLSGIPPVAAALVALTLFFLVLYNRSRWLTTCAAGGGFALMAGGACGNLLDRARLGHVVDYLDLHIWPVFNLADVAIVVGAGLLVLVMAREGRQAQSRR